MEFQVKPPYEIKAWQRNSHEFYTYVPVDLPWWMICDPYLVWLYNANVLAILYNYVGQE